MKVAKSAIKAISILTLFLVLMSTPNAVLAQYYPPVPPPAPRVLQVELSYPEPQGVVTINLPEHDPEQGLREIKIYFKEPVLTASLSIYQPVVKPPEAPEPGVELIYFTIRAPKTLLENVESAAIIFAVDKSVMIQKGVDEDSIMVKRFYEDEWQEVVIYKVDENDRHLLLKIITSTPGLHFAVVGPSSPLISMLVIFLIAVVMVSAAVAYIFVSRRRRMWPPLPSGRSTS